MLVLLRKEGERVLVECGDVRFWVCVTRVESGRRVKLGFDAPPDVKFIREELLARGGDSHA